MINCACSTSQGRRTEQEDAYFTGVLSLTDTDTDVMNVRYVGIYDGMYVCMYVCMYRSKSVVVVVAGHGGAAISQYLATNAHTFIQNSLASAMRVKRASSFNDDLISRGGLDLLEPDDIVSALVGAFNDLDKALPPDKGIADGSTANIVITTCNKIICANCGKLT